MLQRMMDPANAAHGDAVFSQEALDRVITQLMEQNQGSTAPGPAPESAIRSLPKKKVVKDMLDDIGKAECSICMDSVQLGDLVTVLPCTHWFHETCITAWLKEHDTCPHCRKGIATQPEMNGSGSRSSMPPSRPPQRSSSGAMPGSWQENANAGTSRDPVFVEERSPGPPDIRAVRERYYSRRETDDLERRDTREGGRRSSRSTPSSPELRRHRSEAHRSGSNGSGSGGGFSGWVRSLGGGGER
jgi:E3 ubiquitin-protein ligase RNF115/126